MGFFERRRKKKISLVIICGEIIMEFVVKITWHDDENIWVAQSSNDKFALTTDHISFDALVERVKITIEDIAVVDLEYKGEIKLILDVDRTVSLNTANGTLKDAGISAKV
jgi:hypothetical protein